MLAVQVLSVSYVNGQGCGNLEDFGWILTAEVTLLMALSVLSLFPPLPRPDQISRYSICVCVFYFARPGAKVSDPAGDLSNPHNRMVRGDDLTQIVDYYSWQIFIFKPEGNQAKRHRGEHFKYISIHLAGRNSRWNPC